MDDDKQRDNLRAMEAAGSREARERFLAEEQRHILHLTARILKRTVTDSDDEYSIALMAVSEAIDSYQPERGPFWNYAALVIRSRILDEVRAHADRQAEIMVSPDAFGGEREEEEAQANISIREELSAKTAVYIDNDLKAEITALTDELKGYGIDLFELPAAAPHTEKTRAACRELIRAFFLPPPLTEALKRTGNLPMRELLKRTGIKRKLIDRHRKYLLASVLVKTGDYQGIGEYIL